MLDLAATGLGIREVAQQLFMTPGTVQAVLELCGNRLKSVSSSPGQARVPVRGMP